MSRLTTNLIANLSSTAATAAIGIVVVPVYLHILGAEVYGLIAFYLALRGVLLLLDLGVGPVVNREVARLAAAAADPSEAFHLLRTLEVLYCAAGLVIGVLVMAGAPLIATQWLNAHALSAAQVTFAVRQIGVLIAVQWAAAFYQHAILGLQRHVALNAVLVGATVAIHVAALTLLVVLRRSVDVYFGCAIVVGALQVIALAAIYRRSFPAAQDAIFELRSLQRVSAFAAGVGLITVGGTLIGQLDKVLLSSLLPLETFTYYSLAALVSGALAMLVGPLFNTFYPRFSALVAAGNTTDLRDLYHLGAQVVTTMIAPAALVVIFFARDLIAFWTRNVDTAAHVAPIAMFLTAGAALNAIMTLPYALQLAHGWTRLAATFTVIATASYLPLLVTITNRYGAVPAAALWLALNATYLVTVAPPTHRRLLPGAFRRWMIEDVALPAAVAAAILGSTAMALPSQWKLHWRVAIIVGSAALAAAGSAAASSGIRRWITARI